MCKLLFTTTCCKLLLIHMQWNRATFAFTLQKDILHIKVYLQLYRSTAAYFKTSCMKPFVAPEGVVHSCLMQCHFRQHGHIRKDEAEVSEVELHCGYFRRQVLKKRQFLWLCSLDFKPLLKTVNQKILQCSRRAIMEMVECHSTRKP